MDEFFNNNEKNDEIKESNDENNSNFVVKDEDNVSSSVSDGFYTSSHENIIQDEPINTDNSKGTDYGYYVYNNIDVEPKKEKKPKNDKKKYSVATVIICCVLALLIGTASAFGTMVLFNDNVNLNKDISLLPKIGSTSGSSSSSSDNSNTNVNINIDEQATSIAQAVATKCTKSVVGIRTTTSVISFFGGSSEETGEGSGVVYTSDGYIITNYHVIENAVVSTSGSKIEVYFDNAQTTPNNAKVVGYNISTDLAVLKIDASGLSAAELGNSSELKVGQYAVIIGAPGGLEFMGSVTYGIISGLNRVVSSNSKIGLIQTDAAINPGNSGGALLDETGKLIGINSSKIVSEEFEGMGFAIPINTVVEVCNNIIANKDKEEPYVGITVSDKYTSDVLNSYGYPSGAVVLSVADDSPAETCGIRKGDIITEFNGVSISEYDVFEKELAKCTPGTTVSIQIYRSGKSYQADIKIGSNNQ